MRRYVVLSFLVVLVFNSPLARAQAQRENASLQLGVPIVKTIGRGQVQRYTVALAAEQFLQLVVDQRGIDVVVRVLSPDGKSLGEFDTPNGSQGPENVTVTATTAGNYAIEVLPLSTSEDLSPGRYEIKVLEIRHATDQELRTSKNQDGLKAKGIALAKSVAEALPDIRILQTRVHAQVQLAQLLWPNDEKLARKLAIDAIAGIREYIGKIDIADPDYYQSYNIITNLSQEVMQLLAPNDPELALSFLRSTRGTVNPYAGQNGQSDPEQRLEITLATQIATKDPKRAFQIADEALKTGYSSILPNLINSLRSSDPTLAARLSQNIASKLQNEKLLSVPDAANVAVNLLRVAHSPAPRPGRSDGGAPAMDVPLLSDVEYRMLFNKTLSEALAFTPPSGNLYTTEGNAARNIINLLKPMKTEMENFAPGSVEALEKKSNDLTEADPQNRLWEQYNETVEKESVDSALVTIGRAPEELRDQLYQDLAARMAGAGDLIHARQIVVEHIAALQQRQNALNNLEREAIQGAISKGRMEGALQLIGSMKAPRDRANMITQFARQVGNGQKKAAVLGYLEQARSLLGFSPQVEDQDTMNALIQLSVAFSKYDANRGFAILEPLIDQFNRMSVAAVALNGFGQTYFQDGEIVMQGGNSLANIASQFTQAFGALATADFDRAKGDVDRIQHPEVRVISFVAIAQQAVNPTRR